MKLNHNPLVFNLFFFPLLFYLIIDVRFFCLNHFITVLLGSVAKDIGHAVQVPVLNFGRYAKEYDVLCCRL